MKGKLNLWILIWLDNYLIALGGGSRPSTGEDCFQVFRTLRRVFYHLRLVRNLQKRAWERESTQLAYLGIIIGTETFRYFVTPKKLQEPQEMEVALLCSDRQCSGWIQEPLITSFCESAVSQLISLPLAQFFSRNQYDSQKSGALKRGRYPEKTVKPSDTAFRYLQSWTTVLNGDGRLIGGEAPFLVITHR